MTRGRSGRGDQGRGQRTAPSRRSGTAGGTTLFDLSPVGTLAIALAVAAWFAWSALKVQTDLSAGG